MKLDIVLFGFTKPSNPKMVSKVFQNTYKIMVSTNLQPKTIQDGFTNHPTKYGFESKSKFLSIE